MLDLDRPQIAVRYGAWALRDGRIRLQTNSEYVILLFHSNDGYVNEHKYYVTPTLPYFILLVTYTS
jgi:hypothetical protein